MGKETGTFEFARLNFQPVDMTMYRGPFETAKQFIMVNVFPNLPPYRSQGSIYVIKSQTLENRMANFPPGAELYLQYELWRHSMKSAQEATGFWNWAMELVAVLIVQVRSGLTAIETTEEGPTVPQIRQAIEDGFRLTGLVSNAELLPIAEFETLWSQLASLELLKLAEVRVRPSNPDNSEAWAALDKQMKSMGAESFQQTLKSDGAGMKPEQILSDQSPLKSPILMAIAGYGTALFESIVGGLSLRTEDIAVRVTLPFNAAEAWAKLDALKATFQRLEGHTE